MYKSIKLFKISVVILLLPLFFAACVNEESQENTSKPAISQQKKLEEEQAVELDILCVGDIMVHSPQLLAQKVGGEDRYDYTNNYKYVKKYIEAADFAICNLETTFAGKPYSGYPLFSTPAELADAVKDAGFDLSSTANNHMNDRGKAGVIKTQEVLRERNMPYSGSRLSDSEPRFTISEVKGVKIATIAYTYETSSGEITSINGIPVSSDYESLINSFSYEDLDTDLEKMKETIYLARAAGADIVIMFMHWGDEYRTTPNAYQERMAEFLVREGGVDLIFGSHPHVVQKLDNIDGVPVYYSLGNFISNQRIETLGDPMTEVGLMAQVKLSYKKKGKKVQVKNAEAMPIWVEKYRDAGKLTYEVIPLDADLVVNPTIIKTGNLSRANAALQRVKPFIGEE